MTDMLKCLREPGLCSSHDLLVAARQIEDFKNVFVDMEILFGKRCISAGLLDYNIKTLRETAAIVAERDESR